MGKYWLIFVNNKNNPLLSGLVVSVSISLFNKIGISTDKVLLIVPLIFLKIARVNGAPTIAKITKFLFLAFWWIFKASGLKFLWIFRLLTNFK